MKKLTKVSFILILFTIFGGNLILGSSFDCNNANTIREQTICNDPQLSKLDREIGVTFERLNKKGEYYKEIIKRQNTWTSETKYFTKNSFEMHRDFLKFITSFSSCLERNIQFKECYDKITKIDLQECMGNLTNYEMNRCMISFTDALNILEIVESEKLVEFLKIEDSESVSFFYKARNSWLEYRSAECFLFYNFYRKGTIRSIMYTSCDDKKTFDRLEWMFGNPFK